MKVLITGGAGFVGSHAAEYFAGKGHDVTIFDNLSRAELLGYSTRNALFNWNYLGTIPSITRIKGDIRDKDAISAAARDADVIIHTAAQTAVTTSMVDPRTDFEVNAIGTFNVLEAARLGTNSPCLVYCSTNKVYGENVNTIPVREERNHYSFNDSSFRDGIPETFSTDHCEHTPYGCSKLTGDLYVQDYAHRHEVDAAVFRMSCIYGTRQFGVEDQGWVAWFSIATLLGKPITIFGDGKQVRDVLFVNDLVRAYDAFIERRDSLHHGVYNLGGGPDKTMSLLQLLAMLKETTGKESPLRFDAWRPSDQKVYISDIRKAGVDLAWKPLVTPVEGVRAIASWVSDHQNLFI